MSTIKSNFLIKMEAMKKKIEACFSTKMEALGKKMETCFLVKMMKAMEEACDDPRKKVFQQLFIFNVAVSLTLIVFVFLPLVYVFCIYQISLVERRVEMFIRLKTFLVSGCVIWQFSVCALVNTKLLLLLYQDSGLDKLRDRIKGKDAEFLSKHVMGWDLLNFVVDQGSPSVQAR